jgi:hypothetical protein
LNSQLSFNNSKGDLANLLRQKRENEPKVRSSMSLLCVGTSSPKRSKFDVDRQLYVHSPKVHYLASNSKFETVKNSKRSSVQKNNWSKSSSAVATPLHR